MVSCRELAAGKKKKICVYGRAKPVCARSCACTVHVHLQKCAFVHRTVHAVVLAQAPCPDRKLAMAPRRRISTNAGRTTRRRKTFGRRRSSFMARLRYGRQTARAQQGYILRNARLVNKLNRHYQQSRLFTDWKYDISNSTVTTGNWSFTPLTDFSTWEQVMRQNVTQLVANHTFVRDMRVTCIAEINLSTTALFVNAFLVRPRYPSANRPFGLPGDFEENRDWIQNVNQPGEMVRINPSVLKVLAKKQFRLMTNTVGFEQNPAPQTAVVGDLSRCTKRWEWNLKVNMKVSNPSNLGTANANPGSWKQVPFSTLPYYNKIYLLVYVQAADNTAGDRVDFQAQAQYTCINVE